MSFSMITIVPISFPGETYIILPRRRAGKVQSLLVICKNILQRYSKAAAARCIPNLFEKSPESSGVKSRVYRLYI